MAEPAPRLLVLMGQPWFSAEHAWSDLSAHWPTELADRVEVDSVDNGHLAERLTSSAEQPQVVVPCMSAVPAAAIAAGRFGLIQQFGVGVEAIDLAAATAAGVWVANMPGLNAVIIAASHEPGRPPVVDREVIAAMRPGTLLVNIARGGLLDHDAALEAVVENHLGGLGLDVFPEEPYSATGPLLRDRRVLATAHSAALTTDYFAAAAVRLGDAIGRYTEGRPPLNVVNTLAGPARR